MDLYLWKILLAQRTVGVVVQAALQTFEAEGVTAGSRHRLIEQPKEQTTKNQITASATATDFMTPTELNLHFTPK